MAQSRYRDGAPDYAHRLHAGNVGDVLKHCVLGAWLRALQTAGPLTLIDTHAGDGMYRLPPQGEWQAGVGRVDARDAGDPDATPPLVRTWLDSISHRREPGRGGLYPGSPAIVRGLLRPDDRLMLVERADAPRARLEAHYGEDPSVVVLEGDGFELALDAVSAPGRYAVFIDPPYSQKAEWGAVADSVRAMRAVAPTAAFFVWYPIKSLMRPRKLIAALRDLGAGATLDLICTPLRHQKKALNGSGVLLLGAPDSLLAELGATLPWLGATLAHPDEAEWTANLCGWRAPRDRSSV